jgi:hypothetical protein
MPRRSRPCRWPLGTRVRASRVVPGRAKGIHERGQMLVVLARRQLPPRRLESTCTGPLPYVANLCFMCFNRYKGILHLFLMDVAKVDRGYCICCNYFRGMFKAFVQNVSSFQTYVAHVLIWMFAYVSQICCNNMFQMFHLFLKYIASDLSGCCICLQWLCCKCIF